MSKNKQWTVAVDYDVSLDYHFIPVPEELVQELGWDVNDILIWVDNEDGSWTIKRKNNETDDDS